ncbi:MAG: hypothetical protein K0R65_178 [Crocinitomicaceae bacterium]|jgi:hypothetical protein|nr:hypothetical protein [Crocinitomicaceae bacterium]
MKKITTLFHLFLCFSLYSQEINFTAPAENNQSLEGILRTSSTEFYSFSYTGEPQSYKGIFLSKYVDGKKVSETEFGKALKLSSNSRIDKIFLLNGLPAISIAQENGKTMNLFVVKFNAEGKPEGAPQSIQSYKKSGIGVFENFDVYVSDNEKFILVTHYNNEEGRQGPLYKVLNESLGTETEDLIQDAEGSVFLNPYVSNKGEVFIHAAKYKKIDPGFHVDPYELQRYGEKIRLWNSTVAECVLKIKDNSVEEIRCNDVFKEATLILPTRHEKSITDAGGKNLLVNMSFYKDLTTELGAKGIYVTVVDKEKSGLDQSFYWEFSKEFLLSTFIEKEIKGYEKGVRNLSLNPDFALVDFHRASDGNFIIALELNTVVYGQNGNGGNSIAGYESTQLHIVKLSPKGEILWSQKIEKDQKGGKSEHAVVGSSVSVYGDKVFVFFNDNLANYDANGNFAPVNNDLQKCKFSAATTTVALVTMNLADGKMTRENLFVKKPQEAKFLLEPGLMSGTMMFDKEFVSTTTDVFRGSSKDTEHFMYIK